MTILSKLADVCLRSSLHKRVAFAAFWSLCGAVINRGALLATSMILTHILGKYVYGEYGIIRSTVNMFIVFCSSCMGITATKYIAEFRESDKLKTGRIIGLSIISVGTVCCVIFPVCFFSSEFLASQMLNSPGLGAALRLGSVMILLSSFNGLLTGMLMGFEAFSSISKVNIISGMIVLIVTYEFASLWKLTGALIALIVYLLCTGCLLCYALHGCLKHFQIRISFRKAGQELAALWSFSLPAMLNGGILVCAIWLGNAILVNSANGYEAMAGFDIINQWRMLLLFIPTVAGQITLPILSNLNGSNQQKDFFHVVKLNLFCNSGLALAGCVILSLGGTLILGMYGMGYLEYRSALIILLFSAVLSTANGIYGQVIQSRGYAWTGCFFNMAWSGFFLVSSWLLVLRGGMGVVGLAWSYLISYAFHFLLQSVFMYGYIYRRRLDAGPEWL